MRARPATPQDTETIVHIYNQGIEERIATFETRPRTTEDVEGWFGGAHPTVVVENAPSRRLLLSLGFREVGIHEKHARLDGAWKDVMIVERLL